MDGQVRVLASGEQAEVVSILVIRFGATVRYLLVDGFDERLVLPCHVRANLLVVVVLCHGGNVVVWKDERK